MLDQLYALTMQYCVITSSPQNRTPERAPFSEVIKPQNFARREEESDVLDSNILNTYRNDSLRYNQLYRMNSKILPTRRSAHNKNRVFKTRRDSKYS